MLLPFALAERGWERLAAASPTALSGLIYLAVVGTVFAFVLLYEEITRIGATLGGVFVLLGLWLVQSGPPPTRAAAGITRSRS